MTSHRFLRRSLLASSALLFLFGSLLLGCGSESSDPNGAAENDETVRLTIYSGRSESMVADLFERFEEESGISLRVIYDRTPALATRLMNERDETPADVFFAQDPGYLGALANAEMLAELPVESVEPIYEHMRDAKRRWVGTSGRLRVLTYNPTLISEKELPETLEDFADARYEGASWAPGNGSLHAHVSALRTIWGEERTRQFLTALRDSNASRFDSNRPQIAAVAAGDVMMCWTNHYYIHALGGEKRLNVSNYSFPASNDAGNVMMVAGAGILATSDKQDAARQFVEFLLSEESQEFFAHENYEYPTREGIDTHPDVRSYEEISLAEVDQAALAEVDQAALAEVGPTIEMLQELGLQ